VLQEIGSCVCGVDDYDGIASMFNDPSPYEEPQPFDWKGFFYTFNRKPGTRGVGAQDDETAAGGLQKSSTFKNSDERLKNLTPEQRTQ
jgi:hypothetical protein